MGKFWYANAPATTSIVTIASVVRLLSIAVPVRFVSFCLTELLDQHTLSVANYGYTRGNDAIACFETVRDLDAELV